MEAVKVKVVDVAAEVSVDLLHVAKALATNVAWIRFLAGVDALVLAQMM